MPKNAYFLRWGQIFIILFKVWSEK